MTPRIRFAPGATLLAAAFSLWGFAIGVSLLPWWQRPAPPGQLPGFATAHGFDAHGPFLWIAGLMLLPLALPFVLRPVIRRLGEGQPWARWVAVTAPLVTLWLVSLSRNAALAIFPCALAIGAAVALRMRAMRFERSDTVLLPVVLTTVSALIDVAPNLPLQWVVAGASLLVLALRMAVCAIPSPVPPALAFVIAPLGLVLQTGFFARDQRYFGWHALAVVVVTPVLLRLLARHRRPLRAILVFAVYPIALYAYSNALSIGTAEGKPRVSFFEDGHALLPASEYLGGELPYRDTMPAHGLIEDGLFDYLAFQTGRVDIGTAAKARATVGGLTLVALYAVGFAATGSAEAGFLAAMLGILMGTFSLQIRSIPPLATLALAAAAVRRRRHRLLRTAGAMSVLCGLTRLDAGLYTFVVLVVAALRFPERVRALRAVAAGIAIALVPLAAGLALVGILDDFVRTTFVETMEIGPAYTLDFFEAPVPLSGRAMFPEGLAALLQPASFPYIFWPVTAIAAGVLLTRPRRRRYEPLLLLALWVVLTAVSYAERHHLYFRVVMPVLIVAGIVELARRRSVLAPAAIVAAIALASPTTHLGVMSWMRRARGPVEAGWRELREPARARGALFRDEDARIVESVRRYVSMSLAPEETYLDFANLGILHFLTARDNPIRDYEVAFYEPEADQREVIRRLETDPRIRAVLVMTSPRFDVDGIPNAVRAPLVWDYIQRNFHPDFTEGEVSFWRR